MDFLKGLLDRFALAGAGMACLCAAAGCGSRDLSGPVFPTGPDSNGVVVVVPVPQKTAKDSAAGPAPAILIEALSATDLRLKVGQSKPAPVTVLPASATSPRFELTSSKPEVAQVTAEGIRGVAEGSATITARATDGSGKSTKFHVIVDAIVKACISVPCLCVTAAAKRADNGNGNGNGKGEEKAEESGCGE